MVKGQGFDPMLRDDLRLALDRVAFAQRVGIDEPDPWQEKLLRSDHDRVLLNISRQLGKRPSQQ